MAHNITKNGKELLIEVSDRLDAVTAPELQDELELILEADNDIVFDFKNLNYISSGGLRVLLSTFKHVNRLGSMEIINVDPDVMEVLEVSGFDQLFPVS
jgi:anti-sigma B factor antagonist